MDKKKTILLAGLVMFALMLLPLSTWGAGEKKKEKKGKETAPADKKDKGKEKASADKKDKGKERASADKKDKDKERASADKKAKGKEKKSHDHGDKDKDKKSHVHRDKGAHKHVHKKESEKDISFTIDEAAEKIKWEKLTNLPIQFGGRVKPLDTFARNFLKQLSGRSSLRHQGEKYSAIQWLAHVIFQGEEARRFKVFLVENPEVLDAIDVSYKKARDRYSYNTLQSKLSLLHQKASEASHVDKEKRTPFQEQTLELYHSLLKFRSLLNTLAFIKPGPHPSHPAVVKEIGYHPSLYEYFQFRFQKELALRRQGPSAARSKKWQKYLQSIDSDIRRIINNLYHRDPYGQMMAILPPSPVDYALLEMDDIRAPVLLIQRLKKQSNPVAKFIWDNISEQRKAMIRGGSSPRHLLPHLATDINVILRRGKLYQKDLIKGLNLRKKTKDLAEKDPKNARLILLNRLVLEDAFPQAIKKTEADHHWRTPWYVFLSSLYGMSKDKRFDAIMDLIKIFQAYQKKEWKDVNAHLAKFHQYVTGEAESRGEFTTIPLEVKYNQYSPFFWALVLFVFSMLLCSISWLGWGEKYFYYSSLALLLGGYFIQTGGIVMRMMIRGRPPVSTLYESMIFVAWVSLTTCLIIEWAFKDRARSIGIFAGSLISTILLWVSRRFATDGDTMGVLVAVLDSNFWLSTHVTTITIGYAACLVAGAIGHLFILVHLLDPKIAKRYRRDLYRMMYGAVAFATIFAFLGTILGGLWADQSWGRFWGWDPKENGALLIVLWNAVLLHARMGGYIRDWGMALGVIFGNIIVAAAWWGVNLLSIGLHSYGFASGLAWGLGIFCGIEILFIVLGGILSMLYGRQKATSEPSAFAPVGGEEPESSE